MTPTKVTAATARARVDDLCLSGLAAACYLNRLQRRRQGEAMLKETSRHTLPQ